MLRYHDKDKAELLTNRIAFFQNYKQETTSQYLSTVQKAITDFKPLRLTYQAISTQVSTQRVIEPLALYHTQENWILIAWCRLRQAHREFRLDRIQELRVPGCGFRTAPFRSDGVFSRHFGTWAIEVRQRLAKFIFLESIADLRNRHRRTLPEEHKARSASCGFACVAARQVQDLET